MTPYRDEIAAANARADAEEARADAANARADVAESDLESALKAGRSRFPWKNLAISNSIGIVVITFLCSGAVHRSKTVAELSAAPSAATILASPVDCLTLHLSPYHKENWMDNVISGHHRLDPGHEHDETIYAHYDLETVAFAIRGMAVPFCPGSVTLKPWAEILSQRR